MSEAESSGSCLVVDQFLSDAEFELVRGLLAGVEMRPPTVKGPDSVWSLAGRLPYKSLQSLHSDSPAGSDDPVARAYRLFSSRLDRRLPELAELIGARGRQWCSYSMNVFAYPQQADLNWHNDAGAYVGAYTFYIHERWDKRWGGELLVREADGGTGDGYFLHPAPNRLVVLKGGVLHKVVPVTTEAGRHLRTAITGFFKRPDPQEFANQ